MEPCATGYIEVIENIMYDLDKAIRTRNCSYLLLVFKMYINLCQVLLPQIHNEKVHKNFVESVDAGKPLLESLTNGCIELCTINEVIRTISNGLNNSL